MKNLKYILLAGALFSSVESNAVVTSKHVSRIGPKVDSLGLRMNAVERASVIEHFRKNLSGASQIKDITATQTTAALNAYRAAHPAPAARRAPPPPPPRNPSAASSASAAAASGAGGPQMASGASAAAAAIPEAIAATKAQADQVQTGTAVNIDGIVFKVRARVVRVNSKGNYIIKEVGKDDKLGDAEMSIAKNTLPSIFPSLEVGEDLLLTKFNNHTKGSGATKTLRKAPYNIRVVQ